MLENGVHLMVMHESSREAVDVWLSHMTDLMNHLYIHRDAYAPVILDLREPGMMPVGYATYSVRLWAREYQRPPRVDLAVVYRYGLLHKLAQSLSELSRIEDGVRLFHKGRYDDAMDWLKGREVERTFSHRG
ncbi:MAG: hypothetical protein AAF787_04735 [Chloroflexota bacterium]